MGDFNAVIGLEIHIQLNLSHKMFSPERFEFGMLSNMLTSPVSLALPGTLPTVNMQAFDSAIKLGLACHADITSQNHFSRKNYFYPDLPKGYQITQDETPICRNGFICFDVAGKERKINLTRIHIEEDAASLKETNIVGQYHFNDSGKKMNIDFNRACVALLEVVTEPDFTSSEEVFFFLREFRRIVRYLNISNGNMEEGSMRCDANVSVHPKGSTTLGPRIELKNMNSISHVQKAIEYEIHRQQDVITSGGDIEQQTRMFDVMTATTVFQRSKEKKKDYKYFDEPDIETITITKKHIENVRQTMPLLPYEYKKKLMNEYGINSFQSETLIENKDLIELYEHICSDGFKNYITVAKWLLGPIKGFINELKINISDFNIPVVHLRQLISMVFEGRISYTAASQEILKAMFDHPENPPENIANQLNLLQVDDDEYISTLADQVLTQYKDKIIEYKNGKKGLLGLFVGEVLRRSCGKANPQKTSSILTKMINNYNR